VLNKVLVVLHVLSRQRQVTRKAACGNPGIVDRTGPTALARVGGYLAPGPRDGIVRMQHYDAIEPEFEPVAGSTSPPASRSPLPEFADGHER
jgi:hypothetical protein